jgi:hypothetical protein
MPYQIQSHCGACRQGDAFVIGNWPDHAGVLVCAGCRSLVNVPVAGGKCPGCGHRPAPGEYYDYSFAIPYLGGQFAGDPEPGPTCPKCRDGPVAFEATAHLNMLMVVGNREAARACWGQDSMEKAIFRNSTQPVIAENGFSPGKVFEYFHLDVPRGPSLTSRISFPIALDIARHLQARKMMDPEGFAQQFGGTHAQDEAIVEVLQGCELFPPPRKRWWQFWN